ncbi:MAG: class I SAM-dependent methyltransferase [Deltaproteobacteria bacterium]
MTYDAELYARLHRGTAGDVDFYRRHATGAVLEIGAGFGRVTAAVADGADVDRVVGLDIDPALLAMAPAHAKVTYVQGDARTFDLDGPFDRIFAPHGVLWCLLDDRAVSACFEAVARHLAPGGLFVFDVWAADELHAEGDPEDVDSEHLDHVATLDGEPPLDVLERSTWDKASQRLDVTYLYVDGDEQVVGEGTIHQRYLLVDQLRAHLDRARLELVELFGDFAGAPYDGTNDHLIGVARLRGRAV